MDIISKFIGPKNFPEDAHIWAKLVAVLVLSFRYNNKSMEQRH